MKIQLLIRSRLHSINTLLSFSTATPLLQALTELKLIARRGILYMCVLMLVIVAVIKVANSNLRMVDLIFFFGFCFFMREC